MKQPTFALLFTILCLATPAVQPVSANRGGDDVHLPLILTSELDCNVPGVSYGSFPIIPPPTDRPAEEHADLNLALRDYELVTADLELQDYGGDTDPNAPQYYAEIHRRG